jgi:site-specific DNA-methyltransferase (adenine-specific)
VFKQFNSCGELAWTSIKKYPLNKVKITWNGCVRSEPRYGSHPHEKPIGLYKWLMTHYAIPGSSILDTHLGSGSSRIAAYDMGFDFTGFEIDTDYFEASEKRFNQFKAQTKLFA